MNILFVQVDAFTSELFRGNPAGVCPLDSWLPEEIMQSIATENNLAETAFFVPVSEGTSPTDTDAVPNPASAGDPEAAVPWYEIRWFTPEMEVDLCGHATLASGYVVLTHLNPDAQQVKFLSRSGPLIVERRKDPAGSKKGGDSGLFSMLFPSRPGAPYGGPSYNDLEDIIAALGGEKRPMETYKARDYMLVYSSEEEVRALRPDFAALEKTGTFGVIATAPGNSCDFVSRFFAPGAGIPEDPVTGSAHCTLVPYWSERLEKKELSARQISARGGEILCEDLEGTVRLTGRAVLFLDGIIHLP